MSKPVINIEGVWKDYVVGKARDQHATLYDAMSHALATPMRRLRRLGGEVEEAERFWALRDVSFEVLKGDVVGLMGRNGAGKSTLLKILSRITAPTRGKVEIRGRLASLLEVGTGFHPELTGRENIFLNGSILGMTHVEVQRKFDAIVQFAEIEKFLDTAVKRYSSGMYVRLAFAVAAHLDPDILIVDEVLAVGDADFQRKCIGQMETISKDGRTLLVVSHNLQLIQKLCNKAILLESGSVSSTGTVEHVQSVYLSTGRENVNWTPFVRDTQTFQYERVEVLAPNSYSAEALPADREFHIEFHFEVGAPLSGRISILIKNQYGVVVLTSSNTDADSFLNKRWRKGKYVESCAIPASLLAPGKYWITISRPLAAGNEILDDACYFEIATAGSLAERDGRNGVILPHLVWTERVV